MFDNVGRSVALLGAASGLTFCLAGGVAVGVVPQAGGAPSTVRVEAAAPEASATTIPDTVAPTTVAPEPPPPAPADTTTTVRARASSDSDTPALTADDQPASTADAPAAAPTGPTKAARLNPSSAKVKAAIAQIGAGLPISEAQARQFGDQVCSAFDQGQSFSAVKATALQQAKQVPFVTVSAAQVDAAVRSAVQLFCPGYSSQV